MFLIPLFIPKNQCIRCGEKEYATAEFIEADVEIVEYEIVSDFVCEGCECE